MQGLTRVVKLHQKTRKSCLHRGAKGFIDLVGFSRRYIAFYGPACSMDDYQKHGGENSSAWVSTCHRVSFFPCAPVKLQSEPVSKQASLERKSAMFPRFAAHASQQSSPYARTCGLLLGDKYKGFRLCSAFQAINQLNRHRTDHN